VLPPAVNGRGRPVTRVRVDVVAVVRAGDLWQARGGKHAGLVVAIRKVTPRSVYFRPTRRGCSRAQREDRWHLSMDSFAHQYRPARAIS